MNDTRAWSWRHAIVKSDLPSTTRHVLLTISCFMNDLGDGCYPTTKQLADATGLSERAVCTHIQIASDAGWLDVSQHGFRGQKWKNNQYRAAWPELEKGTEPSSVASKKALNVLPKGTEPNDIKALNDVQSILPVTSPDKQSLSETSSDQPSKPKKVKTLYPAQFELVWSAYPTDQNMSKKEAADAWRKLSQEDRDRLAASVPAFRAYCAKQPDYRPIHLCRFIKYRRFDGFAPSEASGVAVDETQWLRRLKYARHENRWASKDWGPMPGQTGCLVPAKLLEPADGIGWQEFKQAA